jgi:hypothetical protein
MSSYIQRFMLERMRLIDMAHAWASLTLQGTARHLGRLRNFGRKYGIDLFLAAPITQPPLFGGNSFVMGGIGVYSPDTPEDGGGYYVNYFQEPPVSGLCLPPLGENASIPKSHVPRQRQ